MKLSSFTTGRDNNFNIIRILAAMAVLVSHSFPLTGISQEPLTRTTGMSAGQMAVDIFFTTSGFLVSASLLTRKSTLEYLCARALRIFPGLLVMVVATVFVLGVCFTGISLASYFASPATYKYLFKNSTLIAGVVYALPGVFEHNPYKGSVNGSLWSMPYEVRLYVILATIWAALRIAPSKRQQAFKVAIIAIAIVSGVWHLTGYFYFSTGNGFSRLCFMFFSGASFYVLKERVQLTWRLFWALALVLVVSLADTNVFFVAYNLLLPYALLFLAYVPAGPVRAYNRLGDYSYGLYIYAFPVQQSIAALLPGVSCWRMMFIAAPVALTLAALSWHLLEKKALGLKSSLLTHTRRMVDWHPAPPLLGKH